MKHYFEATSFSNCRISIFERELSYRTSQEETVEQAFWEGAIIQNISRRDGHGSLGQRIQDCHG